MKYEWKKEEKEIYMPKNKPQQLFVPKFNYFLIEGHGNTNREDFASRMEILYSLSNGIKMLPKKGFYPGGYFEYSLYPLEVAWENVQITDKALDDDNIKYTLMIRQPEFVTQSIARMAVINVMSNKPHPLVDEVKFTSIEDGDCVQILNTGSGDSELESLKSLDEFMTENNILGFRDGYKKIYLNDIKKTAPEKLKTVLRRRIKN